jgi:hypothetical protein
MPKRTIEIEGRKYEVWFDYTKPDPSVGVKGDCEIYEIRAVDGFEEPPITTSMVIEELKKLRVKEEEERNI